MVSRAWFGDHASVEKKKRKKKLDMRHTLLKYRDIAGSILFFSFSFSFLFLFIYNFFSPLIVGLLCAPQQSHMEYGIEEMHK